LKKDRRMRIDAAVFFTQVPAYLNLSAGRIRRNEKMIQITGHTRFGGLLGSPVAHSLSPAMHNLSFAALNIDAVYLAFDVTGERLKETVRVFRDLNTYGFNVTMPGKKHVMEYLDEVSRSARLIGAVNTVVNENGKLIGYNTDGTGYTSALREHGFDPKGKEVTLVGAGGAACAAAVQMALDGVKTLHIVNRKSRSTDAAYALAQRINQATSCRADVAFLEDAQTLADLISGSDLLTNATPIGMAPETEASFLKDPSPLRSSLVVSDMVYNPRMTKLRRQAMEAGCKTIGGTSMLLWQGAEAFRLWTGKQMPVALVRERIFSGEDE
jgi:shikimate dehydrogenase